MAIIDKPLTIGDARMEDWLTTADAAALSGYHLEHIRRLIRSGAIVARKWGRDWQVSRAGLLEYMKKQEAEGARRGPKSGKSGSRTA